MSTNTKTLKIFLVCWLLAWAFSSPWHLQYPWLPVFFLIGSFVSFITILLRNIVYLNGKIAELPVQSPTQLGKSEVQGSKQINKRATDHSGLILAVVAIGVLGIIGIFIKQNYVAAVILAPAMFLLLGLPALLWLSLNVTAGNTPLNDQNAIDKHTRNLKFKRWITLFWVFLLGVAFLIALLNMIKSRIL